VSSTTAMEASGSAETVAAKATAVETASAKSTRSRGSTMEAAATEAAVHRGESRTPSAVRSIGNRRAACESTIESRIYAAVMKCGATCRRVCVKCISMERRIVRVERVIVPMERVIVRMECVIVRMECISMEVIEASPVETIHSAAVESIVK